jgi:hypothetical protein
MSGYQKKRLISRIFDVQKDFAFGDVFVINLSEDRKGRSKL